MEPYLPLPRHKVQYMALLEGLAHRFSETDLTVIDSDVESAIWIGANPGFELNWSSVSAIIRERN
jgi:hypothetical protein